MRDYKSFRHCQPKHTAIDRLLIASGVIGWIALCLAIADRLSS
jgi:hypothetical protein